MSDHFGTLCIKRLKNFCAKYSLKFVLFVTLVGKSFSNNFVNSAESLNGRLSPSEIPLSQSPFFSFSVKYLPLTVSHLL